MPAAGAPQGTAKPGHSGSGRSARERGGGHPAQELDPPGVAGWPGPDELSPDPFLGSTTRREDLRRARVRFAAFMGADVGVDGFPHDRVCELQDLPRLQDRQLDQPVGSASGLILGKPGQASQLGETGTVAEHRNRTHHSTRCHRCPRKTQEYGLGYRSGADATHAASITRVRDEVLLPNLAQERLEEERITTRSLAARRREAPCHARTEPALAKRRTGPDA